MAFDFLNYIVDQTQQNTRLFVEKNKEQRKYIINHIAALQLIQLNELGAEKTYQLIQQDKPKTDQLQFTTTRLETYKYYLTDEPEHIQQAYKQISQLLLTELKQLDDSAHLGLFGLQELIEGQLPWIQNNVEDWFWEDLQQTQHKITKTNKNNASDFNQIMKDFNQIILKTDQSAVEDLNRQNSKLTPNTIQSSKTTLILQPIIAFSILLFLYNIIL